MWRSTHVQNAHLIHARLALVGGTMTQPRTGPRFAGDVVPEGAHHITSVVDKQIEWPRLHCSVEHTDRVSGGTARAVATQPITGHLVAVEAPWRAVDDATRATARVACACASLRARAFPRHTSIVEVLKWHKTCLEHEKLT